MTTALIPDTEFMSENEPSVIEERQSPVKQVETTAPRNNPWYIARYAMIGNVALCAALLAYLTFGTAMVHNREQATLRHKFKDLAALPQLPPQFDTAANGSLIPKPIAKGSPVAWLKIPKLDVSEVVVEGSSGSQTMRGPGHLSSTPLPGQYGNSVVICRRLTGGGPCSDLPNLNVGDDIKVITAFGDVHYTVFGSGPAKANDARIFNTLYEGTGASTHNIDSLTLITSDPAVIANKRYVVQAKLQGIAHNFTPSRFQVNAAELGLRGENNAWLPLLLALQFLLLTSVVAVWLFRRWNRRAAWLLSAPILTVAVWLACEQFARVLPAAL